MQVFHLPHDVCCRNRCACAEVAVVVVAENPRTGERAPQRARKKVPSAITFLALERKPGLPSALLEVAEVKAAIGRGYLRVVEQPPDQAALPSPAPAAAVSPAHSPAPTASSPPQPPAPATSPPSHSPPAAANAPAPAPAAKPPGKEP
jgi:hypothetical protein